ncbi:hypothetical protein NVP1016O_78 [Vibrio phage 1.016.O._10N.286.46.A11]|nr:hypothetical protein NVP1016O_78 [Vibrio phage 1.016.O._10N.286.46.A11]AUR85306.1 hypothetical protein NVP1071A_76 [Vibrio phage 1.071.A._10N.286.46.A12]
MFTFEKKKTRKTGSTSPGWRLGVGYVQQSLTVKYEGWLVLCPDGKKIAEATSKKQAKIIVDSLNR